MVEISILLIFGGFTPFFLHRTKYELYICVLTFMERVHLGAELRMSLYIGKNWFLMFVIYFWIFYFFGLYGHERVVHNFSMYFKWSNVRFHQFLTMEKWFSRYVEMKRLTSARFLCSSLSRASDCVYAYLRFCFICIFYFSHLR